MAPRIGLRWVAARTYSWRTCWPTFSNAGEGRPHDVGAGHRWLARATDRTGFGRLLHSREPVHDVAGGRVQLAVGRVQLVVDTPVRWIRRERLRDHRPVRVGRPESGPDRSQQRI